MDRQTVRLIGSLILTGVVLCAGRPQSASAQLAGGGGVGTGGQGGVGGTGGAGGVGGGQQGGQGGQRGGQQGGAAAGVLVDAEGVVRPVFIKDKTGQLDRKRREELAGKSLSGELNTYSAMRKVSLRRLEAACEEFVQGDKHVTSDIDYLAGLQRIDYVFVDPEAGDIVIAGPAEGFVIDAAGRALGTSTGRPPLRLDDLMVALRTIDSGAGTIGCSIDPRQESLANLQKYLSQTSNATTPALARAKFEKLHKVLGMQDVRVMGVSPDTHFAELLVEADIHMKRLSIGADPPPVKGFKSHLAMVGAGENTMQRWWFTPLYDAFKKSDDGLAFEFNGPRVQLMSQEELVSDSGTRSSAAFSHVSGQRFAKQFTDRFPEMAKVTPMFAELQSLFDLAVLAALIQKERLAQKVGWPMALFLDAERATVSTRNVPRQVESVSNYKTIGKSLYVAQVGGGITIDPRTLVNSNDFHRDPDSKLAGARQEAIGAARLEEHPWWWD